jgi:hypothetical protein
MASAALPAKPAMTLSPPATQLARRFHDVVFNRYLAVAVRCRLLPPARRKGLWHETRKHYVSADNNSPMEGMDGGDGVEVAGNSRSFEYSKALTTYCPYSSSSTC